MSLEFDCSWKALTTIAIRNIQGPPCPLTLTISSISQNFRLELSHPTSANPT